MQLSGPGPSGLRADHLLLAYPSGCSDDVQAVVAAIVDGRAPRWLADARLLALPKKGGGVRPIAVGETLRRVAAAALLRASLADLPSMPRQFVLRRDGCLAVASTIRAALDADPANCVVAVDMRNAFNSVCRSAVINAARPTLLGRYTQWAYGAKSRLWFGNFIVDSCSGVQQGDPAGPALFALALSHALQVAREGIEPSVLDLWYADDGCLVGKEGPVVRAYKALLAPLASIGLEVNPAKCLMWRQLADAGADPSPVPTVEAASGQQALTVLGFPAAGTPEALLQFAQAAVTKATAASAAIAALHHAQGEAVLLRACGPTSRLRHLLRFGVGPRFVDTICEADRATLQHAERIIGRPPPRGWHELAAKTVGEGGLGFELLRNVDGRSLSQGALDASARTVLAAAEDDRANGLDPGQLLAYLEDARARPLPDEPVASARVADERALDDGAWLRAASSRAPHASDFLLATPGPDTILDDDEFHDALWTRLGLPAAVGHVACTPSAAADPLGQHRLGCKAAAIARLRRHDALAAVVAKAAHSADPGALRVEREARAPGAADSRARPGDVALDLGNGRTLVDITVVNPHKAAFPTASRTAGSPAVAAERAFDKKVDKYAKLFPTGADASEFVPLAVTALGVWDERSLRWLRRFSDVCAAATSVSPGTALASLMTKLSVALWRGNSRMIRASRTSDTDIDGRE
jgi:hypothetical protein